MSIESHGQRRACVFCGARDRKISKEHVWPKWLRKVIELGEGGPIGHSRTHLTRDFETVSRETWTAIPIDWAVSGPCEICNGGWMERIEVASRPILKPMLRNEQSRLDLTAQDTLAQWATLRMMMAHLGLPSGLRRSIAVERYHGFYRNRQIPPGAQVWLARYDGSGPWPTQYRHREFQISREPRPAPNTYLAAFSVGCVAFVYWGHEVEEGAIFHLGKGMEPFLVSVWPPTASVTWPPKGILGATGIEAVAENLIDSS